jgi:hypothetical protein
MTSASIATCPSSPLNYNLIIWASNTSAAIVRGGFVSRKFNKAVTLYAGYWEAPGRGTLTGSFPYFLQPERSMADQFFRPGFTQGSSVYKAFGPYPGSDLRPLSLGAGVSAMSTGGRVLGRGAIALGQE